MRGKYSTSPAGNRQTGRGEYFAIYKKGAPDIRVEGDYVKLRTHTRVGLKSVVRTCQNSDHLEGSCADMDQAPGFPPERDVRPVRVHNGQQPEILQQAG